ncbi:MAG: ferredoxin-type protein NapG [Burkholderiaceae bacterium]|nr:ferredoxin-type protein NapG [Burkholderiaceae bacterium]
MSTADGKARERRQFLLESARMACGVGALGLGLGLLARDARSNPPLALRPPGALAEPDFLGACLRCGLCLRDCPYDILRLATPDEPVATGTPYFLARHKPCEMCEDIPCVKACPSGALDPALTEIGQAQMGLAVLVDQENCLNFLGLRCDICYRVCPVIDRAITLEEQSNLRTGKHALFIPVVHSQACTGCGKCEKSCPLEVAAIKVYPRELAKGEPNAHYRLGWIEKEKAGASLVAPDVEHRYHLPEGLRYEQGRGLLPADAPAAAGAPAAPASQAPAATAPAVSGSAPSPLPVPPAAAPPAPAAPFSIPKALQGNQL